MARFLDLSDQGALIITEDDVTRDAAGVERPASTVWSIAPWQLEHHARMWPELLQDPVLGGKIKSVIDRHRKEK